MLKSIRVSAYLFAYEELPALPEHRIQSDPDYQLRLIIGFQSGFNSPFVSSVTSAVNFFISRFNHKFTLGHSKGQNDDGSVSFVGNQIISTQYDGG